MEAKQRRAILGSGIAVALGSGAAWRLSASHDDLARIARRGRVRIGYAVEPPYAFVAPSGRVSGETPETARLVAERLRWQIDWVQTDFDALIPQLQDDRFDVIASGLFITPQRQAIVSFARPELRVSGGMVLRHDDVRAFRSLQELAASNRIRAAVLASSVEESALRGLQGARLVVVPDAHTGATAVKAGLVDVLVISYPSARALVGAIPHLRAVQVAHSENESLVAAAFRPADRGLLATWNVALANVLGSEPHRRVLLELGFDPLQDIPGESHRGGRSP